MVILLRRPALTLLLVDFRRGSSFRAWPAFPVGAALPQTQARVMLNSAPTRISFTSIPYLDDFYPHPTGGRSGGTDS